MLFDGKSADEVIKAIDERQARHETYRYDYEPKREEQEAKIVSASEFTAEKAEKQAPLKEQEKPAETEVEESSAETPAEVKPVRKPRKTVKKDDVAKPEDGDDKKE